MNFKLFSLLISLTGSVLLTPVEKVFSQTIEHQMNKEAVQHLTCVKEAQHLQCTVESSKKRNQKWADQGAVQTKTTQSSKSSLISVAPQAQNPTQQRSVAEINQSWTTNTIAGLILLIFVCSGGLGLFLYKEYRTYRVTVLRQNIEVLEKLWKTSNIQ